MTNRQKRNSYKWLRLVALWTVLSFTVTSGVNPSLAKAAASSLVPVEIKVPLLMDSLNLPTSLGELQNEYRGGSQTEIIHIQDAHANAGAQQKTVEILSLLQKEHGVDLVFLEGGKGEHDARAIDFFQNSELNDQFADKLIEQGMLSGTEKFLLQESTHVTVLGVEDLNLYKQNLTAYREVLSKTPAIEAYLYKIQTDIRFRIDSHFNPKLKNFFREWVFHREVSEALLSQLHSLKKYAGEVLYQDLNDVAYQFEWPHLLRFFKLEEFESQINKGLALEELEAVMKWADTHQMKKEVILKLKSFDESNQSVSLNKRQVLEQFYREATKDQFSFQDYPEFSRYAGFQILKSELDAMHLMREMDALTKEILAKLTQTDVEKEILKDYHGYLLSKKLLSLELSDSEYEEVLTLELETEEIKDLFEKAHKFYELAKKRETAMVQNMTQKMKELGKTKAVLVSGGFHAKGIHQILQGQGISNVQIMPHVETVSSTASYREIMFAGKGDLAESSYLKHINPSMTLPVVATIDPVTAAYYAQTYLHVLEDFIEETHTTQGSTPTDMGRQFQGVVTSPAVTVNGFGKNWIEAATKVVFEGGEDFVTRAEKSPPIRDTPEKETPNERQSDLPKTTRSEARYYDDGEDDVIVIRRTPEFYDDDFEDDFLGLTKVSHKLALLGAMIISVGIIGWLMERSSEQPRKKQTPVVRTEVQEEVTQPEAKTLQEDQRQASIPNVVPIPDHSRIVANKPVRTRPDILDYAYLPAEHQNRITRSESREERIDAALKMGDYKEAGSVYVELRAEQGDNQTIKQKIALTRFSLETLKESTNRIKWYRAIENLKALETVELVQVTIAIARGIEMKLSLPKFAFNDEKYDESLYRYIASWVFHMGAIYGTDFVGIGVEGDESLVDVDRIIKLLKVEGLQDIRPGVETSAEEIARREKEAAESGEAVAEREPLGINKYANASNDVRILPLQELTDEMRAKLRFDQTKDVDPDYAGNYLGIDIGGSGIKFGVKRGGNYITLPENLAKIETILIDEFGNEQLETGAEWVARVAAHAAKIKERLGIQFDGVGMDAPGTADLQNNRMMTLGQVEQKQKWTNEGIEQVWTIVEEVTKAIDLPVEKGVIRNDMDAVMPGVVSVLPKVKEDFWKRTKGNFRFDWHGTGHGHQYSFGGLPFPGPTEAHVIYDFGKPGEDIFDTERHTSIPGMLDYARKAGFPDTQGKFLPVGLAAADKEDPNHKIAMDTFKQFAKHYAQNLALGYYMMESTGIGVADTVLLGGGPMSGESGRIFRDLTIKELAKYNLDTQIDIELLTNKEIESAGAISSIDDIGPYGAASLIQNILQTRSESREVSGISSKFFPKILAELKTIQEALGVDLQTLEDEASENIQAFFYASLPSLLAVAEEGEQLTELDQAQSAVQTIEVAMNLVYDDLYTVSEDADAAADDLMNLIDQLKTALGKIEAPKKFISEPAETDVDEDAEFDAWVAEHGDDVESLFEDEADSGDSVVNDLSIMMNILNQSPYDESWGWIADILAEVMSDVAMGENASAAERMTTLESQVEDLDTLDEIEVELSVGTRNIRQAITSLTESLTNRSEARGEVRVADDDFEAVSRVGNDVTWRVFDVSLPVAIQERLVPEAFAAEVSAVEAFHAQGSGLMDEMIAAANRTNVQENQVAVLGAETSKEAASSVDLFSPNAKAVVAYFQGNKQSIEAFKFAINELNQLRVSKGLVEIKVVVNARELRDTVASFAELGFEKEQIVGHYMTQTDAVALKRADVETLLALDLKNIESPAAKALQNLFQKMMAEALIRIAA